MNRIKFIISLCLVLGLSNSFADSNLWQPVATGQRSLSGHSEGRDYRLDMINLNQVLSRAGLEGRAEPISQIELPLENGEIQRFTLEESSIMAPGLAAKYPDLKTYKIHGIDNPYASGRLSISSKGFHGMITSPEGTFYIDPQADDVYRVYNRNSQLPSQPFNCGVKGHNHDTPAGSISSRSANRTAGSLQVYELAVAGTAEYVAKVGPTISQAQAEIVVAINRVNQIYERDLGVRLKIISGNDQLLYLNSATDPYTNNSGLDMLDENQANLDSVIGALNYDIGHVFSTGGGGIASVGSVCGNFKAQGVTGLSNPTGDAFYIDFIAHEIGHQFGADHTFNGTTGSCAGNRVASSAFEPGGGSTIMAYAGICGDENIVNRSNALFHAGSINQIDTFTTSGAGNSCGSFESANNTNEPTVDAGNNYTIPRRTPFVLTATGSDLDGDPLEYSWDQIDAGLSTNASILGVDLTDNSLFRSYIPRPEVQRHFPTLGTTLQNKYDDSEVLACQTRDLNFRVTVRDGESGMGQDDVVILVDNTSGPFEITSFNTAQSLGPGSYILNWDVANTDQAPVSCAQVDISLLTFNAGKTTYFENSLANNVINDGAALINILDNSNTKARFKIQCSDNVFYDISDADLIITGSSGPFSTTGNNVFYNTTGLVSFDKPAEVCTEAGMGGGSTDESNSSFNAADTITFNANNNYGIQTSDDTDFFQVNVPSNGTLVFKTSGSTDTFCRLFTTINMQSLLMIDDDSGDLLNCQITSSVKTGIYYFSVEGFGAGYYSVTTSFEDSGGSSSDSGAFDLYWLLFLLSAALGSKWIFRAY